MLATADVITFLLADKRTGKSYSLRDDVLEKTSVANTATGRAHSVRVYDAGGLVDLLDQATSNASAVLIPGHFAGNDNEEPFDLVYEQELADLLGKQKSDAALAGVHTVNGRRVAARLKRGIEPCIWTLLDFDKPPGMPPVFADLDIAGRLALMEKIVPGISTRERVEARSSSARIVKPGGKPGRASHAWIQVSDPALVELLRVHVQVEATLHGLSFMSPRHSAKDGAVIGQSRRTLLDLAVWIRGRIVFCSAPTITPAMAKEGWSVADAGVTIVNPGGGVLDIGHLTKPAPERLQTYHEQTGEQLEISGRGASFAVISRGPLDLGTAIETDHAPGVTNFGEAVAWLRKNDRKGKVRCQTPFRFSSSEAAFIRLDESGEPFLHDVGTATTYRLAARLDDPPPPDAEPDNDQVERPRARRRKKASSPGSSAKDGSKAGGGGGGSPGGPPPAPSPDLPLDVGYEDFVALMTDNNFIFRATSQLWPSSSVNARLPWIVPRPGAEPISPASWLRKTRPVEQWTWVPGEPQIIRDRLIVEGGWIERTGAHVFNQYKPPTIKLGDAREAERWRDLLHKVWPDDAGHLINCFAHRRQRPGEKINHALVLGGPPGIGKDTLLQAVAVAIGPWNLQDIGPPAFVQRFNGFAKAVILRISEARDTSYDRYQFYEHMKVYAAAPPDTQRIDEKNRREYYVPNLCLPVITTNHKTNGVYLPADDRRHYVAWSDRTKDDFTEQYWKDLWHWYEREGGFGHVAAFLDSVDLADFNAKAPPPKTEAFWTIVNAARASEDAELADALDKLGNPIVTTINEVMRHATGDFNDWLCDRKNRRNIPHRFEACGYLPVRNPDRDTGLWVIKGERQVVYGRRDHDLRALIAHIRLMNQGKKT